MSQSVGAVNLDVRTNTQPFQRQMTNLGRQADGIAKRSFGGLGKVIAGAFAVGSIISFSKSAIGLASNLEEVQNVVDVTFGNMNQSVNEWSRTMMTAVGMSEFSAKKYSSTLGAMFKSMGMGRTQVYAMSTGLARLAGDMASFYNLDHDTAFQKIRAGMSGETEPLKQLGINMSVANMEAYAMSQGITQSYQAMSQLEQTQLRYNYLLKVTSDSHGDFIRTSDGWANQTRLLSEGWKEFMTTLGQGLVVVFNPFLKMLNAFILRLQVVAKYVTAFVSLFGQKSQKQVSAVSDNMAKVGGSVEGVGKSVKETGKAIKGSLSSFDQLNTISSSASDSMGSMLDSIGGGGSELDFGNAVEGNVDFGFDTTQMELFVSTAKTTLSGMVEFFKESFALIGRPLVDGWVNNILPVLQGFGFEMYETLRLSFAIIGTMFMSFWSTVVLPVVTLIKNIWLDVMVAIGKFWNTYGAPIFTKIREALLSYAGVAKNSWETIIKPVWENFMRVITDLWDKHLKPLLSHLFDFVGTLIKFALDIYNGFIAPITNALIKIFGPTFARIFNAIVTQLGWFIASISDVVSGVLRVFTGLMNFITGVFTGNWRKAWEGLRQMVAGVFQGLLGIVRTPINQISTMINGLIDGVNNAIRALNRMKINIPSWVPLIGGQTWGMNLPTIGRIPMLENGGIVSSPTLAIMGEKNKKEAVIPLENSQFLDHFADKIATKQQPSSQPQSQEYSLEIDGIAFARLIVKLINDEQKRSGVNLITV